MNNYHNKCPEKSIIVKIKTSLSLNSCIAQYLPAFYFFVILHIAQSNSFCRSFACSRFHDDTKKPEIFSIFFLSPNIIYTVYIFKSLSTITSCNSMNCLNLLTVNRI